MTSEATVLATLSILMNSYLCQRRGIKVVRICCRFHPLPSSTDFLFFSPNMFYRLFAIGALAIPLLVKAQNSSLTNLVEALTNNNLTSLVQASTAVNSTQIGQQLISILSSGEPLTLFAPNNHACEFYLFLVVD